MFSQCLMLFCTNSNQFIFKGIDRNKGPIDLLIIIPKRASPKMIEKGGFGEVLLIGSELLEVTSKAFHKYMETPQ